MNPKPEVAAVVAGLVVLEAAEGAVAFAEVPKPAPEVFMGRSSLV